ncbi:hypothetical protein BLOT_011508 [Blomia tropicalis]|nr:hypothetical protein BLOT_011508 [Blomia tropicalis]
MASPPPSEKKSLRRSNSMGFDRMWYASNVLAIIDIERNGWSNKNEWFIGQIEPMVPSLLNLIDENEK